MSGFYLLALTIVWFFVGWIIYRFWNLRKPTTFTRRIVHIVICAFLFLIWFGGPFWEVAGKKMYWDAKVRKMCAKDGGVKVYETVELPEKMLDWAGRIKIPDKSKAKASDEFYKDREITYYHRDNPQVTRWHTRVIRRSDGKVLGEYTRYGRGGGDMPGFWHESSFSCSDITGFQKFESAIFIKGDKK